MKGWWEHYNFDEEPFLSTEPITEGSDMPLFFGRSKEIKLVDAYLRGKTKKTVLLTGAPGVGKTTFICRLLHSDDGFIRFNLSKEITRIENVGVTEIINEYIDILLEKNHRIYFFLDETDFFNSKDINGLVTLFKQFKENLPQNSALVAANRDIDGKFSDEYNNAESLVRLTFTNNHELKPLIESNSTNLQEIVEERFKRGKPRERFKFPLAKNACHTIVGLSGGNFRLLLQYLEEVLIQGSINNEKLPLSDEFVNESIFKKFDEANIDTTDEREILNFLRKSPSHLSDDKFQELQPKSTLHEILQGLEKKYFVKRDTKKRGVKQIYSITPKAEIALKYTPKK
jgi:hypothetical protein